MRAPKYFKQRGNRMSSILRIAGYTHCMGAHSVRMLVAAVALMCAAHLTGPLRAQSFGACPAPNGSSICASPTNANVGIGTTAPAVKLDIAGTNGVNAELLRVNYGFADFRDRGDGFGSQFQMTGGNSVWFVLNQASNGMFRIFQSVNSAGAVLNTDRMVIDQAGYVGIGTISPADKLQVYNGRLQLSTDTNGGSLIASQYAGLTRITSAASGGGGTVAIGREPVLVHGQPSGTYTVELWSGSNGSTPTLGP